LAVVFLKGRGGKKEGDLISHEKKREAREQTLYHRGEPEQGGSGKGGRQYYIIGGVWA